MAPDLYRTKTGRILTDADLEALADEAERGYDVEHLKPVHKQTPEEFQARMRDIHERHPSGLGYVCQGCGGDEGTAEPGGEWVACEECDGLGYVG
jgi:hypothetical protein